MSGAGFEILLILLLLVANGALSMSEIAIVSARKARLQKRAEEGDARAQSALELAESPNQLLSTVQVGITLVGILAGAFGGATLAEKLGALLAGFGLSARTAELVGVVVVVAVITYLSVIIGELVPKRLALNNPEGIASRVAGPMRWLSWLGSPVVWLLGASTNVVLWLLRVKPSDEPAVTEDEVRLLIRQGTQLGTFEKAEQTMIERVFRLGDRKVSALMTPRTEVLWIDLDDPLDENLRKMARGCHSYYPVCQGNRDRILGVASVKHLWVESIEGKPRELRSALLKALFVPETVPALKLLELFKQAGTHVALVIDEYGGFSGMVTLNDVLGSVVGDVAWNELGEEPQILRRDDGSWLFDGLVPLDEAKEALRLRELPGEETAGFQTLGGFVMDFIGRVPHTGDHFEWNRLRFEVVDMDGRRVDKVLVIPLPEPPAEPASPPDAAAEAPASPAETSPAEPSG